MVAVANRIERIKQRYIDLEQRAHRQLGRFARPSEADPAILFDPMMSILHELLTGGIGNTVNFLRNRDFFVGIERDDLGGAQKFLDQLPSVPDEALDLVEEKLTELEQVVRALENENQPPSVV